MADKLTPQRIIEVQDEIDRLTLEATFSHDPGRIAFISQAIEGLTAILEPRPHLTLVKDETVEIKKARYVKLGWELLEHKCRYYIMSNPIIEDYDYDMLEKEYEALAEELGLPKSATDMVDFDTSRPSCQRVMQKLVKSGVKKPRTKKID